MFKAKTRNKGPLYKKAVVQVLDTTVRSDKKSLNRLAIQEQVFDTNDAISDNAKMISFLTTIVSRIYDTLSEEQKASMPEEDRALIEYTFNKFQNTNTRADLQLQEEGTSLIDKLLDRQGQIGTILGA